MPYIKPEQRANYDEVLVKMPEIKTKGELEYCIYKLMLQYVHYREKNYSNLHDCCYAATHCADEFRGMYLDKREDAAREVNGDIKPF